MSTDNGLNHINAKGDGQGSSGVQSSANAERLRLHDTMLTIRAAEEHAKSLFADGHIPGFIHLSIGQEAVPAGTCAALQDGDTLSSTHRGHGHAIAKGLPLDAFFLELMGKADGVGGGRGGSMHVADLSVGMLGANGIVGGGLSLALGSALAHRHKSNGCIAVAFFGDGAVTEGAFHECLNLAVLWRLPVLFVCENNGWSEFSPASKQVAFELAPLAAAFKLPYARADGNDVEVVADAAAGAVDAMRSEPHPRMLEFITHRARGHFEGDPQRYRDAQDKGLQPDKDPIVRSGTRLSALGYSEDFLADMTAAAQHRVEVAVERAKTGGQPDLQAALANVYASGGTTRE